MHSQQLFCIKLLSTSSAHHFFKDKVITKEELLRDFKPEINKLAEYEGRTFDEAIAQLAAYYDGYHFSYDNMVDVFNPFSLINAFADSKLRNYWASSGATSLLTKFIDDKGSQVE